MSFDDGGIDGDWRKCINPDCPKYGQAYDYAGVSVKNCMTCHKETAQGTPPREAEG